MVHTHSNQRQEQEGAQEASDHTNDDGLGHADSANNGNQSVGEQAGDGHDDEDIGNDADEHNNQGRNNDVQSIGHLGADPLLDLSQQQNAEDDSQNAATASAQNCVQSVSAFSDPEDAANGLRNVVDVSHCGDSAQHTAQDGGSAELLSCTVASPSSDGAHECGVDHGQELMQDEQPLDGSVVGVDLSDHGSETGTQTGSDNAGDQGNKDVTDSLQSGLDLALLLSSLQSSLVFLPVVLSGSSISNAGINLEQVGNLLCLAGAQNDVQVVHFDNLQNTFGLLQTFDVSLCVILQVHAQTGHAVDGASNVFLAADQLQDLQREFLICH